MRKILGTVFAIGLLPAGAFAQSEPLIDYGYLDVGLQGLEGGADDFTGAGIRGSMPINRDLFVTGEFSTTTADTPLGDIDRFDFAVGVGYHMPIARKTDLVAELDYLSTDMDEFGDDDGFRLGAGVRSMVAEQLELRGSLQYYDVVESEVVLNLGAQYHFNQDWAAFAELSEGDDYGGYFLGARYDF